MGSRDDCVLWAIAHKDTVKPIDVGPYIGNHKCHVNSLDYAIQKKAKSIIGCIQVFADDTVVAHFVVRRADGTIVDPTYGRMASRLYSYLVIVEEYKVDSFEPSRELTNLKKYMFNMLPWNLRIFKTHNVF